MFLYYRCIMTIKYLEVFSIQLCSFSLYMLLRGHVPVSTYQIVPQEPGNLRLHM